MYKPVEIDRFRTWTVGPMATKRHDGEDVGAEEINDFVDGAATPEARRQIAEGLLRDPDANARMRFYRQQVQELHRLYDGVLDEPMPDRLADLVRRARSTARGT
jgi:anti-sigma factor RsiW